MGYCPFPALGRDTTGGVATWAAGRADSCHGRVSGINKICIS